LFDVRSFLSVKCRDSFGLVFLAFLRTEQCTAVIHPRFRHISFHATPDSFPRAIPNGCEVYKFWTFEDDKIIVGIAHKRSEVQRKST
jgi:hypothetical protein